MQAQELAYPTLDTGEVLKRIEQGLVSQGLMRPLQEQRLVSYLDHESEIMRRTLMRVLPQQWSRRFPGVAFTEERLLEQVNKALSEWQQDALSDFLRDKVVRQGVRAVSIPFTGLRVVLPKWELRLLAGLTVSAVTIPLLLTQMFAPSDLQLYVGALGTLANVGIIAFLWRKAFTNHTQEVQR